MADANSAPAPKTEAIVQAGAAMATAIDRKALRARICLPSDGVLEEFDDIGYGDYSDQPEEEQHAVPINCFFYLFCQWLF